MEKKFWRSVDDHRRKLKRAAIDSTIGKIPIGAPKGNLYLNPFEYDCLKEDIVDGKYDGHVVVKLPPKEWKPGNSKKSY
jgi:hypothetical protein